MIGPMADYDQMARLNRIKNELLAPILGPLGYLITLPHEPRGSAQIFKSIMANLDTADLLVADLSEDNPNVYYELAIRHSLGLPYVLISTEQKPRFDIQDLRFFRYNPNDLTGEGLQSPLAEFLAERHGDVLRGTDVTNPITDFYGAPLAEVSPAAGLALGYFKNFVEFAVPNMLRNDVVIGDQSLPKKLRLKLRLQIWIPDEVRSADQHYINDRLVDSGRLAKARIVRSPRDTSLYALPGPTESSALVDVPTTMSVISTAITSRYPDRQLDKESHQWKVLQAQEIERFTDHLRRQIRNASDLNIARHVSIHDWSTPTDEVTLHP